MWQFKVLLLGILTLVRRWMSAGSRGVQECYSQRYREGFFRRWSKRWTSAGKDQRPYVQLKIQMRGFRALVMRWTSAGKDQRPNVQSKIQHGVFGALDQRWRGASEALEVQRGSSGTQAVFEGFLKQSAGTALDCRSSASVVFLPLLYIVSLLFQQSSFWGFVFS